MTLNQAELKRLLHYDPETGVFTWLVSISNRAPVGNVAGTKRPDGYLKITIYGKHYLAHRLAWLYMTGEWPGGMLDHKNLDRSDTTFENLREATRGQNNSNTRVRSHSKIGVKGVCKNGERWMARITIEGKNNYIGTFDTIDEAHLAYAAAANLARGEFARLQ